MSDPLDALPEVREWTNDEGNRHTFSGASVKPLMDTIEALRAERDRLREALALADEWLESDVDPETRQRRAWIKRVADAVPSMTDPLAAAPEIRYAPTCKGGIEAQKRAEAMELAARLAMERLDEWMASSREFDGEHASRVVREDFSLERIGSRLLADYRKLIGAAPAASSGTGDA